MAEIRELDPILEQRAWEILQTETNFKGIPYLLSGVKRQLDLLVTVSFSPVTLPAIASLGLVVWLQDLKNPFVRTGNGAVAYWKLRTMVPNAHLEQEEYTQGLPLDLAKRARRDPRITVLGRIFRKLSVDELPQLCDVARGTISLVGPRMFDEGDWKNYVYPNSNKPPFKEYLHYIDQGMKYGLTGFYGILGRSDLEFMDRIWLDVLYGREANFKADLKIIALTFPAVLSRRGAY